MGLAALFISISGLMTSFLLNMVMGNEESQAKGIRTGFMA